MRISLTAPTDIIVTGTSIPGSVTPFHPWEFAFAGPARAGGSGDGGEIVVIGRRLPQKGHDYKVDVDVSCSAGQTFDAYLESRTAPEAGRPANGQTVRNVQLYGGDWIRQTIDYNNRTILNETIQGRHRFDPGSVFIRISPTDGGANISIIGRGTGADELLNRGAFYGFFGGGAYAEKIRCAVMGDGG